MELHHNREDFRSLSILTAEWRGIPAAAVYRDYFAVKLMQNLQRSEFAAQAVFKGGTSLSKCYPGSIERFSEDIDLSYMPRSGMSDHQVAKELNRMETAMIGDARYEKISEERNDRNKSALVWFESIGVGEAQIKLEIGSNVRPEPFDQRPMKTYIQEYLESRGRMDVVSKYDLASVMVQVLRMERTFADKVFAVKRHAIGGTLHQKVRHLYDVTRLIRMPEVRDFLQDGNQLKSIVQMIKRTDFAYLEKRKSASIYQPGLVYDYASWKNLLNEPIRRRYENLHIDLLYTHEKQDFSDALAAMEKVGGRLREIGE